MKHIEDPETGSCISLSGVTVIGTAEEDLIQFHDGWSMGIQNGYNLWHDTAVVKALGADHPDDASILIIRAVWKSLIERESV